MFDLDGTLIDSAPDIHAGANVLLAEEGCEPLQPAETRSFIGRGVPVFIARMRAARGLPEAMQDPLVARFLARYDTAVGLTRPYPGVREALERLAGAGHRLGICTNKPIRPCRAVLAHLELDRFFETVWGGDSLPVRKPDPAPLDAAFEALGAGPRLYVGDSEVDAETAMRAGVPFLLFTEGYRQRPAAELPHAGAFDRFEALPALAAEHLAAAPG